MILDITQSRVLAGSQPPVPWNLGQPYDGSGKGAGSGVGSSGEQSRMQHRRFSGHLTMMTAGVSSASISSMVMDAAPLS